MNYNNSVARKLPSAITLKCDFQWLGKCFILSYTIKKLVKQALKEDIGKRDITTELVIPKNKSVKAVILARQGCVVCGLKVAELVFKTKDKKLKFKALVKDGQFVRKGKILAQVQGKAWSISTAERVALNFLGLLSGIATKTRRYVNLIKPYKAKIMDTRKTIPGLRELEKYAVRQGGGYNHRFRLDEMVLIKDNHLKIVGGYKKLQKLPKVTKGYQLELEVKNLREFKETLRLKPDIIMLDNMKTDDIRKAVMIRRKAQNTRRKTLLEASGGINLANIKRVAATGVDMISLGDLTHSIESINISLEVL